MFGIVRPCGHRLGARLRREWAAHLCGLCLALRADHGQLSRFATNYDGVLVSVLVEAQTRRTDGGGTGTGRRTAGPCPLRGMRTASVAGGDGPRLAATVSLVLASAKARDHAADGDGVLRHRPLAAAARRLAAGWDRAGARTGAELGFDTTVLVAAAERQQGLERALVRGGRLTAVTEPTETATAAAFAHTAVLAGVPRNAEPLAEVGRLFGRLAHLLDAVEDLAADERAGAWNPVAATGTGLAEVRRLCDDAVHGIRLALRDVEFTDPGLAHRLLTHELPRSVDRAFRTPAGCAHGHPHGRSPRAAGPRTGRTRGRSALVTRGSAEGPGGPGGSPSPWITRDPLAPPPRRRGPLLGCAVFAGLCVTGQVCCRDPYEDPWDGRPREGWCHKCADCGDCCDCCPRCGCGGGEGDSGGDGGGDGCDCCDCDCGCDCGCG